MAFNHAKNARLWVDGFELTSFFSEFGSAAKAGTAETTVFGLGAKAFIGGLKEGTLTGKGYFDPTAVSGPDAVMTAALGRNTNACFVFSPNGKTVQGTPAIVSEAALTDFNVSAPVTGVVATNFSAQADSGLTPGDIIYSHDAAAITTNATFGTQATTATGAVSGGQLPVAATAGFPASGGLIVQTSTTPAFLLYTSIVDGTHFGGVTTVVAGGVISTGAVKVGMNDSGAASPGGSSTGFVAVANVLTLVGTSVALKIQHSADGLTWVDLGTFGTITAVGGYYFTVQRDNAINGYLRAVATTTGITSTTFGIAAARQ